jgi:hypothetical protein
VLGVFSEDVTPAQKLEVSIGTMTLFYEVKLIEVQGKNGLKFPADVGFLCSKLPWQMPCSRTRLDV